MIVGYTKLSSDILTSSLWNYDHATVRVWITILALVEPDGMVRTNSISLAHLARVTQEECDRALSLFSSPDPLSRSFSATGKPGESGERITVIKGGLHVINAKITRNQREPDSRREQVARAVRKHRESKRNGAVSHVSQQVSRGKPKQNQNQNQNQIPKDGDPDIESTKRAENSPGLVNDIVVGCAESGTRLIPESTQRAPVNPHAAAAPSQPPSVTLAQSIEDALSVTQVSAGGTGGLAPSKDIQEPIGEAPKFAPGDTPYERMVKARKERERSEAAGAPSGRLGGPKYNPVIGVGEGSHEASGGMPPWWLTACDVVEMASGIELNRPLSWLRYSGHRDANAKPMGQSDAQYWLTSVDVADARKERERERAAKDNYAANRERRFTGPEKRVDTKEERAAETQRMVQYLLGNKKKTATP